jgi:hypothetical protein
LGRKQPGAIDGKRDRNRGQRNGSDQAGEMTRHVSAIL